MLGHALGDGPAAVVVEPVGQFVPDGRGDVAVEHGVVQFGPGVARGGEDGGGEGDLVVQGVVVGVHRVGAHAPFLAFGRPADAGELPAEVPGVHLDEVVGQPARADRGLLAGSPFVGVADLGPEGGEFGEGLGNDFWMLNLDNYTYSTSSSLGGSMTGLTAKFYSGNVSLSAVPSETGAVVTVTRKVDVTAPAAPALVDVSGWRFPEMEMLKPVYEDAETAIKGFAIQVDGVAKELAVSEPESWWPTYLNPFEPRKTVFLKDLPEGSYNFALRAVDLAGNKSPWTPTVKVTVDRGRPVVAPEFSFSSFAGKEVSLAWNGVKDPGSGLCQTNLVDEDGLVTQSSEAKSSPVIKVQNGVTLNSKAQAFDCIGNGVVGDLSVTNTFVSADKSSKTGKWSPAGAAYPAGSIKCVGKCTLSMSVQGSVDVLVGSGASTVTVSNKVVATIADSKAAKLRVGARVEIGKTKKVIRLTGSNFVAVGANTATATFTNEKLLARTPAD